LKKILFINVLLALLLVESLSAQLTESLITVAKDGSGDFNTIQAALDAIPDGSGMYYLINIKQGIYEEKLFIEKNKIILKGDHRDSVKIIFPVLRKLWREEHPDDYGAAVINIRNGVTDLIFDNLTVYNNYGSLYGDNDHQFAIRGGGTRIIITNCNIVSDGGDALSLWNSEDGMYYHNNCYFEGWVDFVCPRGWCFIENSTFFGHNKSASIWHDGSKNKDQKLVIRNSLFDGVEGFALGRHHRDAQFYLLDCTFSEKMRDKEIYYVPQHGLQWDENRKYFFNCIGKKNNYSWHSDNLSEADGYPLPEEITAQWTFNDKWNPYQLLSELGIKISK
jgi:pectinesterase